MERESPVFLTVEEAASLLRLRRSHAYELVTRDVIPSVGLGRFIRVTREAVMRMVVSEGVRGGRGERIAVRPARP